MENTEFDVVIIGSGPGGYVAAVRCAQLGMKTAIVEKYKALGGTCLNVGCIPSKALLDSSEHYHNAAHTFETHGILLKDLKVDIKQMVKRKTDVVNQTVAGVQYLMKKNKITVFTGHATFTSANTIEIKSETATQSIKTKKTIIATGSKPSSLPGLEIDKKRIITSTEALNLQEIPGSLVVIGAGVIGLEIGSVFARLGTKVTVVEYGERCIAGMDIDLGKEIEKVLTKSLGFAFHFQHKVKSVTNAAKGKKVTIVADGKDGKELNLEADYCLVAVGRRPYTDNLGLDKAGVKIDERGKIIVNERLETNVPGIFAIGDVIKGAMLAHKASEEGVFVAEIMAGQHPHINYNNIPGVVYTWPEVSGVGYTEQELTEKGIPFKKGKFDFRNIGRARASMDLDGFVKILAHKDTDEILGIHMIGPRVADLIAEAVVALEFRASAEDIAIFSHAHPTFAEAVKEAALAATANRAIHI